MRDQFLSQVRDLRAVFRLQPRGPSISFDLVELGAQRFVGRASFRQHSRQAHVLRFFLLERAQGAVEGRNKLVKGVFEIFEFVDLSAGVGQAQNLIFLAYPRTDIGKAFDRDVVAAVSVSGASRKIVGPGRVLSLRPKRSDNFAMTTPPNPNANDSPECARVERYDII